MKIGKPNQNPAKNLGQQKSVNTVFFNRNSEQVVITPIRVIFKNDFKKILGRLMMSVIETVELRLKWCHLKV